MTNLQDLTMCIIQVGEGLKYVRDLKSLRSIDLRNTPVTDAQLKVLADLPSLETVMLGSNPNLTDSLPDYLVNLPNLKQLCLDGIDVTEAVLPQLKLAKQLESLWLWETQVSDQSLVQLQNLSMIQELDLDLNPQLTDACLVHLQGLKNLKRLNLSRTGITPQGIADLQRRLPNATIKP